MPIRLPTEVVPLASLLEKEEPKVLVVVGTGVSLGATTASHASWLGLLKHGVEHLVTTEVFTKRRGNELNASLDAAFSPFDLTTALQHAELVEQNLTTPDAAAFAGWLDAAFRDFKAEAGRSETLDALRDLQQTGALLLTTNYDSLLSDATGLPPVTWEEHAEFFRVIRRQQSGILHIHGHWKRPSSVVLGKNSYDRIARDQDFQDVFKSLWLERSWLYVGCGDGLDDPNLGRLLEWGKRWNKDTPPDYFLAIADKALALASRPDKPANLVSVGYSKHSDLPILLRDLTPAARCWPFIPVDKEFALFRSPASPLSIPFPSREEYLRGDVPALTADAEVHDRLEAQGWAFVLDVASVGKTTLALRMATALEQREDPTFYLDLATIEADDAEADASAAMKRLSRPDSLLILDNVHHQPELARRLWDQWRHRPRDSKLLMIATRMQRAVTTAPAQDLGFFERHATNPAVELRPTPDDLGRILKHLYLRGAGDRPTLPIPASPVLNGWHRDYGGALGAFCVAALSRLTEFKRGNWELPIEAASDWVREKWLKHFDAENLENLLCLAAFGTQELELQVLNEALPHPGRINQLLRLGLVAETQQGQFGQYHWFSLREPGWGPLLLAAHVPVVDEKKVLFESAARHPSAALSLSARLRRVRAVEEFARLWTYLAANADSILDHISLGPLTYAPALAHAARDGQQPLLANRFWEAIEHDRDKLVARAWEAPLGDLATFLDGAKHHQRDTEPVWEAIERDPHKLAQRSWETPLHIVARFLKTATRQGRDTGPFWMAIEHQRDKLVARACEAPLGDLASFLDGAKQRQRITKPLWEAIEREPYKFAERAWETPLHLVARFLRTATRQGRDTGPLWEAIERESDKLASVARETPLGELAYFLEAAQFHQRKTEPLWEAIEREPDNLATRAWETPLAELASFLDFARRSHRKTEPLWEVIEREPDKLATRAWETPLAELAKFLDVAKSHKRDTVRLWEAIEREPDRLAARAWETPLAELALFLDFARRNGRNTEHLWEAIEREPDKLAECALATPLNDLASFLNTSRQHEREIEALVEALESKPARLSEIAQHTSLGNLAGFCRYAPDSLVRIALAEFQVTHWDGIPASELLIGATWVASRSAKVGRDDLKSGIITTLLRRANPRDFPPQGNALGNVAWLLDNVPSTADTLVPSFLDALCTKQWLGSQFTFAACGRLATGLRRLALHQPPQVCHRFLNPSLGFRLQKELSRFSETDQDQQSQIIGLLGCAMLCGWPVMAGWFNGVPLNMISKLPVEAVPHRDDAVKVEDRQLQLWLGLRAVTKVTRKPLAVASELVVQTLNLWLSNLADPSENATSAEHRLNQTMVTWLESCSRSNQGLLPPAA